MNAKILMCTALVALALWSGAALAQDPADDPFGGGFPVNYKAEVLTMGAQNDSLHSWAYNWLSGMSSLDPTGDGSFPESYQCGANRDIAHGDFDGDYVDEVVVVWDRADGGVFVGIPTIDPETLAPDPSGWNLPDMPIAPGVLYATPVLAEVRVVAGNFYDDLAEEFVLAYLAVDGTVTLTVFDVDDSLTSMASISDQAVNTDLPELQQIGAVSRFDIATGDFDGDGLDEIALIVNDPAGSPATQLALKIYKFDPVADTLDPTTTSPIAYAANADIDHPCLRSVLIETGNFEPDSLDEIAILDSWSRGDVDSSRVGTLHTLKLNTDMDGIDDFQMQSLPPCSWQSGANGPNGPVYSMTTYNDELIVGGQFTAVGGLAANNIASWDGTEWHTLGAGVDSTVLALEVYGVDLIVGGAFTQAGGAPADHLARWDGTSWEEFGDGANGDVYDLLASTSVITGSLFACGNFTTVGDTSATRIARWDGYVWQKVGGSSGLNGPCLDMMEYNGTIVVTGGFTLSGANGHYIAYWKPSDPNSWYKYGNGLLSEGTSLENYNGTLVVGGLFTYVWGWLYPIQANRLAYYVDDGWWSPYGAPGLNNFVWDVLLDDGMNNLYVGGRFSTAGGIDANGIARFATGTNTWNRLSDGVTAATGTAEVKDMCFYDDELIAGGWFDNAGGVPVSNIARWNYHYGEWHAFARPDSLPPVFSVGLAVGRFDANSELDDIAITACASDLGNLRQYVRVYGVDTSASPLTLSEKGETNLTGYWTHSELARSRRLIAIDDITGDGQADLAVLTSKSLDSRIEIYEPCDITHDCTFDPMPQAGSWDSGSDYLTQLVLADLDTLTAIIGPPTHRHVDSVIQPLAIIYAPPVHYDILNDTTWDLSDRYPYPLNLYDQWDTYVTYYNSTTVGLATETRMHRDWGISEKLRNWINVGGSGVDSYLENKYGEGFETQGGYSEQITVGYQIEARDNDQVHAAVVTFDILEYPVFHGRDTVGHVLVATPSNPRNLWKAAEDEEYFMPNHEVDNILSYPGLADIPVNPLMASGVIGNSNEAFEMNDGTPRDWWLCHALFESSVVTETWDVSLAAGSEFTLGVDFTVNAVTEAGFLGTGFQLGVATNFSTGLSIGLDGYYAQGQISTFSTSFAETDSLHVHMGLINSGSSTSSNDRRYLVTPYAYWANNGALVLDFAVAPKTHDASVDPSWWQVNYSDPDPAFILPWRLENEKREENAPEDERHKTKEIFFYPPYPEPGDSIVIAARVHNFSLTDILDPVAVSFYLGNPDNGGVILYDKNSGDSIFYTRDTTGALVNIDAQGNAFVTMKWQVPLEPEITSCQRIWALIDPLDEISPEVHDNGDWATNNKGWNLLRVNTTNDCYDSDGDGYVEPAYRCCDTDQWDNCPNVANPYQEDSDEDGIGDSCEVMVYLCGDPSGDAAVNIGDAVHLINYIFKGGPAPEPLCVGDGNGDDAINIGDAVHLINYIFKGGPAPVEPCCP